MSATSRLADLRIRRLSVGVALVALLSVPAAAQAVFPGVNGKIVFTSSRDGNREIYSMDPDGQNQTNLTNDPGADYAAEASASGATLVFAGQRSSGAGIHLMNADGSQARRITDTPGIGIGDPTYSPDGGRLAVVLGTSDAYGFAAMNGDGSGLIPRMTARGVVPAGYHDPAYAPRGGGFLISHTVKTYSRILAVDDGGSIEWNYVGEGEHPSFSPDGSKVVFTRSSGGGSLGLGVTDGDGSNPVALTVSRPGGYDFEPSYSPDGTKIVFSRVQGSATDLYSMNSDGTAITRLTSTGVDSDAYWSSVPPTAAVAPPVAPAPPATGISCPRGTSSSVRCWRDRGGRLVMLGTRRGERFVGSRGVDRIFALGGRDRVHGKGGDDRISGGSGADRIGGGAGGDRISGAGGADRIYGGPGNDRLTGGDGRDRLFGGTGDDRLSGQRGRDLVVCGRGRRDRATRARADRIGASCERVSR
ncbi:MAG: hypothetical protein ACLGI5_13495 [Thermoleophilia bacterium]